MDINVDEIYDKYKEKILKYIYDNRKIINKSTPIYSNYYNCYITTYFALTTEMEHYIDSDNIKLAQYEYNISYNIYFDEYNSQILKIINNNFYIYITFKKAYYYHSLHGESLIFKYISAKIYDLGDKIIEKSNKTYDIKFYFI
jgi:hypothetical protein